MPAGRSITIRLGRGGESGKWKKRRKKGACGQKAVFIGKMKEKMKEKNVSCPLFVLTFPN